MDYGREIAGFRMMDTVPRLKNRIMTRLQHRVLAAFADLEEKGSADSLFAKLARTLLGAHLYSIKLELNTACTLNCKMCYIEQEQKELTTEQWKNVFERAVSEGLMFALFTGGEAMLRDDFVELYEHLFDLGVKITVFSNGSIISDDIIKAFRLQFYQQIFHARTFQLEYAGGFAGFKQTICGRIV